jgi:hypothetical protein
MSKQIAQPGVVVHMCNPFVDLRKSLSMLLLSCKSSDYKTQRDPQLPFLGPSHL